MNERIEYVDCLVIGAGIAGIMAATRMAQVGKSVCILEKSRGIGGRMATRRIEGESFDHGAQFFTTRSETFAKVAEGWVDQGIARPWFGEPNRVRYSGVGGMNALAKRLAAGLDIRREQRVVFVGFKNGLWTARSESEAFTSSRLLITSPAPQVVALLDSIEELRDSDFFKTLADIDYDKCITLMILLKSELGLSVSGFSQIQTGEPIATITETSVKGDTDRPGLVIQSGPEFAETNFGESLKSISSGLLGALPYGGKLEVEGMSLQKWRFAKRKKHRLSLSFLKDDHLPLWHAGDGYVAPRIEGAFLSGARVAGSIIEDFDAFGSASSKVGRK